MKRRVTSMLLAAAVPALGLTAQTPAPNPTPPATQDPAPAPTPTPAPPQPVPTPPVGDQPVDPTRAAADLLRRRLGLQNGPQGQPPSGPPTPPPPGQQPPNPVTPASDPAAAPATSPQGQEPAPATAPATQEPQPPQPNDPTRAAAEALRRLLPTTTNPGSAPIPNASGTPEPLAPGQAGVAGQAAAPLEMRKTPPPVVGLAWNGILTSRYRARHGEGASDQDVTARLSLDFGLAERDPFTFHFDARGFADLDGSGPDDPFAGLDQSLGNDINGRLYAAHLDAHQLPHLELARLGRQDLDETPTLVTFDGARVDTERFGAAKVFLSAYGGIPVHHFEASNEGDSVYGIGGGLSPWRDARVRLDWMSLRDEYLAADQHDELLGVRWWQNLQDLQLHGLHTWSDGKPRDLNIGLRGELGLPLTFAVDYRELLTSQGAQVTELDPFYTIALDYKPYRQIEASVSRDFGDHWTLGAGAEVRRLRDADDEGSFNREFERTHVDATVRNLGAKGLSLTVAGSAWNSAGEDFRTLTGDLEYRPDANLRIVLGTGYDLFRYDAFDADERVHVRSYYLRSDYRLDKGLRIDAGYEYEHEDADAEGAEFHLFRLGMTWTF